MLEKGEGQGAARGREGPPLIDVGTVLRLQTRLALRRPGGTRETKDLADKNGMKSTVRSVVLVWCCGVSNAARLTTGSWHSRGVGEGSVGCSGSVDGAGAGQTLTGGDSLVLPFLASPPGCGCRDLRARRRRRRRLAGSSPGRLPLPPPPPPPTLQTPLFAAPGGYSNRTASTRVDRIPGNPRKATAQCNGGRFLGRGAARAWLAKQPFPERARITSISKTRKKNMREDIG